MHWANRGMGFYKENPNNFTFTSEIAQSSFITMIRNKAVIESVAKYLK